MTTTKVATNPLKQLQTYGQSVWLDFIRRNLITSGELAKHIEEDGLRGMTSNPAIFEKAIAGSTDYDNIIEAARKNKETDAKAVYEHIAIADIKDAADLLKPVYAESKGRDGYISLEVSPYLAHDTEGTIEEAKRLWKTIARPNVMIKVPATKEGLPAIRNLIGSGINVNVTLLFSQNMYAEVVEQYISGVEDLAKAGGDLSKIASVASFFISRIDTAIDTMLEDKIKKSSDKKEQELLKGLLGKVAIANGKQTYQSYQSLFSSPRWKALEAKGAHTQRVLWASTSTKNPNYPDTIYVDELIGPDTVNTIPPATYSAFRDHGKLNNTLTANVEEAAQVMNNLKKSGISIDEVTDKLLIQGVELFADAFKQLLGAVQNQLNSGTDDAINHISYKLPEHLSKVVEANLAEWQASGKMKKLWSKDASLWTNQDEGKWLDWLNITDDQIAHIDNLKALAKDIQKAGFTHALLLGMGGSSLCPEVMEKTFGKIPGFPQLLILDSTDPAQIREREKAIDIAKTIFIVASKSGSTLEPNIYKQYFFERTKQVVGADKVGQHFIAITDPNSHMQKVAEADKFRHIFYGVPGIGGRYSALSNFGMVPAMVSGIDVPKFLDTTEEMVHACSANVPVKENPGAVLGIIMGTLAKLGRDKVTIAASPAIYDLGAWLEQLLAESTGKEGHGIIPVDLEALAEPEKYGQDRLFVYIRLESKPDASQDKAIEALEKAGMPVVRITMNDIYQLGQEFFRWEIATAVAGSIIGINAFNQPDVEASKIVTKELTTAYEKTGSLPAETPFYEGEGFKLFSDDRNVAALKSAAGTSAKLSDYLKAHLARLGKGDYFALLAYIEMNDVHHKALETMRLNVRDHKTVATCLGFGPRFLHSTGQAYKGGPNTGVFLQLTCDDAQDLQVPDQKYTFGIVKAAQARGDFQVLADRNRRALRVHITGDLKAGLKKLGDLIAQAVK